MRCTSRCIFWLSGPTFGISRVFKTNFSLQLLNILYNFPFMNRGTKYMKIVPNILNIDIIIELNCLSWNLELAINISFMHRHFNGRSYGEYWFNLFSHLTVQKHLYFYMVQSKDNINMSSIKVTAFMHEFSFNIKHLWLIHYIFWLYHLEIYFLDCFFRKHYIKNWKIFDFYVCCVANR